VDRESAYELLAAKLAPAPVPAAPTGAQSPTTPPASQAPAQQHGAGVAVEGAVAGVLSSPAFKSFARSAATVLGREITRSLFGTAKRRR
jgi:hypothetical protein